MLVEVYTPHASPDARAAVELMTKGVYGVFFWSGLMMSSVLPLLILISPSWWAAVAAGVLFLAGSYLTEFVVRREKPAILSG